MKRILIISSIVLLTVVLFIGYKYMYKDHRNIEMELVVFDVSAIDLGNEFNVDMEIATKKYLDQTIIVRGVITEVDDDGVVLNGLVYCRLLNKMEGLSINDMVSLKGRCIGYDDLLEIIKMDQTVVEE